MPFLEWWFESHYVWAVVVTPLGSLLWAFYREYDLGWMMLCLVCLMLFHGKLRLSS